jgi:hypothetical protein
VTYQSWLEEHLKKHKKITNKLSHLSDDEVIEYFNYENMQKNESAFCPLYKENKKCHDMSNLNCYYCACPYFRFNDNKGFKVIRGKKLMSFCSIDSKYGSTCETQESIHQDCSNCKIPHF